MILKRQFMSHCFTIHLNLQASPAAGRHCPKNPLQLSTTFINLLHDNNPTNPPVESLIPITPQYKDGKLEARKEVSNHEPKLGKKSNIELLLTAQ